MSKSFSPTAIGSFVIGALVLIVVAVLIFSSGNLFTRSFTAVAVFPGSVKGLAVGSPVEMRGVKIGSVTDINILTDMKTRKVIVPVYLEIVRETMKDMSFQSLKGDNMSQEQWNNEVEALIQVGLRGQLITKSLVTGQVIVDVDFHPNTPIRLSDVDSRYLELPTIETKTDRLLQKVQNLPIEELLRKAISLFDNIDQLVTSQDVKDILYNTNLVTQDTHQLLTNVNSQVEPLANSAQAALTQTETTMKDVSSLSRNVDAQVQPLSTSAIEALQAGKSALVSIDNLVGKDSTTRADLDAALEELAKAANSLRTLTDYLEQHPEALLKGKGY